MELPEVPDDYDPFVPVPDPFTPQAQMAARGPVHRIPGRGAVFVTGMRPVLDVLRDGATFSSRSLRPRSDDLGTSLIHLDGEEHARQRRVVSRAFVPRVVNGMRPRIEELAHALVDTFCTAGAADLVETYSGPLPSHVMSEALGVPAADRPRFMHWADDAVASVNVNERPATDAEFRAYVLERIEERRRDPGDDLISHIVNAEEGEERLTTPEAVALVRLLLIAGIETTANLIASLVRLLLEDRSRWEAVLADRSLVPAAVEEALRLDPPLNWTPRLSVGEGAEIGGCPIEPGTVLLTGLGSANRDPSVHKDPDAFAFHRPAPDGPAHVTFGFGPHYCLGAPLARLEADIALNVLLDRLPDLALAEGWVFEPRGPQMMRGCRTLDVVFSPTAPRHGAVAGAAAQTSSDSGRS